MLSIVGIVLIVVAAVQVYKTANGTGRNGSLWAVATVAAGICFQLVIPIIIGIVIGIVYIMSGSTPEQAAVDITGLAIVITIVCLVLSFIAIWLIFRHVSKVRDDERYVTPPPPPPNFTGQ